MGGLASAGPPFLSACKWLGGEGKVGVALVPGGARAIRAIPARHNDRQEKQQHDE